jgi:hypothetical protein
MAASNQTEAAVLETNCEGPIFDFRKVRDCQRLIAYVCWNDGTRRHWLGPPLKGLCGKLFTVTSKPLVLRALACEQCSRSPEFQVMLEVGVDPRNLLLDN